MIETGFLLIGMCNWKEILRGIIREELRDGLERQTNGLTKIINEKPSLNMDLFEETLARHSLISNTIDGRLNGYEELMRNYLKKRIKKE